MRYKPGKQEYLNEKRYQRTKKKLNAVATIVLIVGLFIGGGLIITGLEKQLRGYSAFDYSMFYALGGFVIFVSGLMIALPIYLSANGREIDAFYAQQKIPIAQEGIEEMAPTMGYAAEEIARGISRGVKEGRADEQTMYCKYCGAEIDADSSFCKSCGGRL